MAKVAWSLRRRFNLDQPDLFGINFCERDEDLLDPTRRYPPWEELCPLARAIQRAGNYEHVHVVEHDVQALRWERRWEKGRLRWRTAAYVATLNGIASAFLEAFRHDEKFARYTYTYQGENDTFFYPYLRRTKA